MKKMYEVRIYGSCSELLSIDAGLSYRDAVSLARSGGGLNYFMADAATVYDMHTGKAVVGYGWTKHPSNHNPKWVRISVS